MNAFWKWLMKTNAKAVFLFSLLVLLGVILFWVWMLSTTPSNIAVISSSNKARSESRAGLPFVAQLDAVLAQEWKAPGRDPFMTDIGQEKGSGRSPRGIGITTVPVKEKTKSQEKTDPATKPAAAEKTQAKKSLSLTYKGMYKSSDGGIMVLMEDSESKMSKFYDLDSLIFGMKIGNVSDEKLELIKKDGSSVVLKRGGAEVF